MIDKTKEQSEVISMWVTPETAKEVEEAKSPETKEKILVDYARSLKNNMKAEIEALDDDILEYRALMATYKKAFREAKEEQLKSVEDLWHDFEKDLSKQKDKSKEMAKALKPLKDELEEVNELLDNINHHRIERLLKLVQELNGAFYGETKNMLKFLFDNYKNKQS